MTSNPTYETTLANDQLGLPITYPEYFKKWLQLCQDCPELAELCGDPISEPAPPAPLPEALFRALVGTLRHPGPQKILSAMFAAYMGEQAKSFVDDRLPDVLASIAGICRDPERRQILQALLFELLAEPVAKLIEARIARGKK